MNENIVLPKGKKIEILEEFIIICNENKVWYSLDEDSLLLAYAKNDFSEYLDNFTVILTYESYELLKQKYPQKFLDNSKHSQYFSLQIKFMNNIQNIYESQPFLDINLLLPTKINKLNKFITFRNKLKSIKCDYLSYNETNIKKISNKIYWWKLLGLYKTLSYKTMINAIHDESFDGYVVTNKIVTRNWINKWIPNVSFKIKEIDFFGLKVKALFEYEPYLRNIYGKDFENYIIPEPKYRHLNPIELWNLNALENSNNTKTNEIKIPQENIKESEK